MSDLKVLQETICTLVIKLQEQEELIEDQKAQAKKYHKWWIEEHKTNVKLQSILDGLTVELMERYLNSGDDNLKLGLLEAVRIIKTQINNEKN